MEHKINVEKYTQYNLKDFLEDDYFILSVTNPDADSIQFWEDFAKLAPDNINDYYSARNYIETLSQTKGSLSAQETEALWNDINHTINKTSKRKKLYYTYAYIAASIAILLALTPFALYFLNKNKGLDISEYARTTSSHLNGNDETQLILSENNVLAFTEKESVIRYDSAGIKANEENVSKNNIASFNQLITPRGKRSVLTLSDGSKIWINAGTRVIYPPEFEKNKREIYVDGEIFIEVTKDKDRPFYVRTKDMNIRVLGTVFNVTAYESDKSRNVILVSGSVEVDTEKSKAKLAPNQMFYASADKETISSVDVERYISWVDGLYYFEKENLETVFKRLSIYYGINIDYASSIAQLKCSGKLDMKDDIEKVLEGLSFAAPIKFSKENETTYKIEKI